MRTTVGGSSGTNAVLDASIVREGFGSNTDRIQQLVSVFAREVSRSLRQVEALAPEGDLAQVAEFAHSIKSSASFVGGMKLRGIARDVEDAATEARRDQVQACSLELRQAYDELVDALREQGWYKD